MIDINEIRERKPIQELLEFCIINVDKPANCTSFDVAEKIRKIFGARKTGHFGTLDPMVTGVLPVALNRACKLVGYFMHHDKVYIGKMYIHEEISEEKLKEEMKKFVGKIKQMPPVKSAVKRQLRERRVNRFDILKINGKVVEFIADVEAGTYIRKLCSDLGEKIGGAHMTGLRRIKAGIFEEKNAFSIENIEKAFDKYKEGDDESLRNILIPAEIISEILPVVQIKSENLKPILTGKPVFKKDIVGKLPDTEIFAIFSEDRFIGIYKKTTSSDESETSDIIARAEFVLN